MDNLPNDSSPHANAAKAIEITATTRYPIVTAYEYEFLKLEDVVRDRLKNCTVYAILQRASTYFDNLTLGHGTIRFEICDSLNKPIRCSIDINEWQLAPQDGGVDVKLQFYAKHPSTVPPFRDVAAIQIYDLLGNFLLWLSPQKFLYEVLVNRFPAVIEGDITPYLTYAVLYIGKSYKLNVWERLTGHDKLQKALTLEGSLGSHNTRPSFEISLLMLDIVQFSEVLMVGDYEKLLPLQTQIIKHDVSSKEKLEDFEKNWLSLQSPELTSEIEAHMISEFRPPYNDIMYGNYPNITNGTRSRGYSYSTIVIEKLPAILFTPSRKWAAIYE